MKKIVFEKTTLAKVNKTFELSNSAQFLNPNKPFNLMRVIKEAHEHVLSFDDIIMLKDETGHILSVMTFKAFDNYRKKLLYTTFYDKNGVGYKFYNKIEFENL